MFPSAMNIPESTKLTYSNPDRILHLFVYASVTIAILVFEYAFGSTGEDGSFSRDAFDQLLDAGINACHRVQALQKSALAAWRETNLSQRADKT